MKVKIGPLAETSAGVVLLFSIFELLAREASFLWIGLILLISGVIVAWGAFQLLKNHLWTKEERRVTLEASSIVAGLFQIGLAIAYEDSSVLVLPFGLLLLFLGGCQVLKSWKTLIKSN